MNKLQAEEKARMALYLNENGCPVQLEPNHRVISEGLKIKQVLIPLVNKIFDLESGAAAYLLDAHLISNLTRPIRIEGVQIKPPWEGSAFPCWRTIHESAQTGGFTGSQARTLAFEGSEVLNGLLSGRCKSKPRDDPEGLIMAIDTQPIPDDVSDRERIDVKLTVFDGAGNGFSSDFRLCVDRSAIRARQRKEEMLASSQPRRRRRALIPS